MANERIKVAGYSQKVTLEEGIEYRNFSPDLVGVQLTSSNSAPLFTLGNFSITKNVEPKQSKVFRTTSFSNFVTLADLNLSVEDALKLLRDNAGVILNLDKRNVTNYALFGSFREFVRVSLEHIITNWPAALYVSPIFSIPPDYTTQSGSTVLNYSYDTLSQTATFNLNVNNLTNQYGINYLANGNLNNTFNETNPLRDLVTNYTSYAILVNNTEYEVLNFVGAPTEYNSFLSFKVKGDPFSSTTTPLSVIYYIKPNKTKEEEFFNTLPDFEYYLLNRTVVPKYTATFDTTLRTDNGAIINTTELVTWPTSDGYNLDFTSDAYEEYATSLLEISSNLDLSTSNLMIRFLVAESITDFDTTATRVGPLDQDTSDQKVNKTLTIYGREYDEINKFITGVKFANTVSYNKLNNTPDIYLKNIARVLGWELISSVLENNLLKNYVTTSPSTYLGQSVGLTAVEADIELWRRLILNSPWLWKSKGTRKGIEFLFKFIGTPLGLIKFNEYIYLAENKIDMDLFQQILEANNAPRDLRLYPISVSGYPQPFPNTSNLYFQNYGLWYRETGGQNSNVDITSGNNPHVGPYDGGYYYINQFRTLIQNFSSTTITTESATTSTQNIFTNYNLGTMTAYSGLTYVDLTRDDGSDFSNAYVVNTSIIQDPKGRFDESFCGCQTGDILKSLSVCIDKKEYESVDNCNFADSTTSENGYWIYYPWNYDVNGNKLSSSYETIFASTACCETKLSVHYNEVHNDGTSLGPFPLINSGYICCSQEPPNDKDGDCGCFVTCNWSINSKIKTTNISGNTYLVFVDELGVTRTSSYNGCNCLVGYTQKILIRDPFTGDLGYACQLIKEGKEDINSLDSIIIKTYQERVKKNIGCNEVLPKPEPALPPQIFTIIINDPNQVGRITETITYGNEVSFTPFFNNRLVATSASGPQVGLFFKYESRQNSAIEYGSPIRLSINTGTTGGIAFDKTKNKIGFLVSPNEYTVDTILSQLPNFDTSQPIQNQGVAPTAGRYYSDYVVQNVGTPTNLYLLVDYREPKSETPPDLPPDLPQEVRTFCHAFINESGQQKTINWRDVNNQPKTEPIAANTTVYKCAVENSASGTDVTIVPSTNACTSDLGCSLIITPESRNFIVINNTNSNKINSVTANGTQLISRTSGLYPVEPQGGTISATRSIATVVDRITVNVDAPISSTIRLYRGTTLLDEKILNLASSNAFGYNHTFRQATFNVNDVIRIIFEDNVGGGDAGDGTVNQ